MKNLIIFAHPYSKSFGKAIVDTIEKESIDNNVEIQIRDLYELEFNPILSGNDLINLRTQSYADDIEIEQEYIKWADVITVVYPVWWASMPAILKGYIDRVFANGFAFKNGENGPMGLLEGKKAILFSTTGFPSEIYEKIGMHSAMKQTTDKSIFEFCGIEVIDHVFLGAVPTASEDELKKYLEEVKIVVKEKIGK